MKKLFIGQKISFVVYIIIVIATFIYTLGFMTAYADLEMFDYEINKPIQEFHNSILIPFNNLIFWFAIVGVIGIVVMIALEYFKKIPDLFAYVIGMVFSVINIIVSVIAFVRLPNISNDYNKLDFSGVNSELPSTNPYTPTTSWFDNGLIVYGILSLISIILILFITLNYINGLKIKKGGVTDEK